MNGGSLERLVQLVHQKSRTRPFTFKIKSWQNGVYFSFIQWDHTLLWNDKMERSWAFWQWWTTHRSVNLKTSVGEANLRAAFLLLLTVSSVSFRGSFGVQSQRFSSCLQPSAVCRFECEWKQVRNKLETKLLQIPQLSTMFLWASWDADVIQCLPVSWWH